MILTYDVTIGGRGLPGDLLVPLVPLLQLHLRERLQEPLQDDQTARPGQWPGLSQPAGEAAKVSTARLPPV